MDAKAEKLIDFIVHHEAGRHGYDAFYAGSPLRPPKPPTQMTVAEVLEFQDRAVKAGSKSSAIGGPQFIRTTLRGLVSEMGLTGQERFDAGLQRRLAHQLLRRRGYDDFRSGRISMVRFANNLAHEWASMPLVSGPRRGRSAYDGDGLNAALTSPDRFLSVIGDGYWPVTMSARDDGPPDPSEPGATSGRSLPASPTSPSGETTAKTHWLSRLAAWMGLRS